jgi:hypothetical protein
VDRRRAPKAVTSRGFCRLAAIAVALAAGLLLVLVDAARAIPPPEPPASLAVVGGSAWRRTNDFDVTWDLPTSLPVVGAGWRLTGAGFDSGARYTPGEQISRLDGLQVPGPGEYSLAVWLRDLKTGEDPSRFATVPLRLDDVPPTLAFEPVAAGEVPAYLIAPIADPLSGPQGGSISYRRAAEPAWRPLPTELLPGGATGTRLVAETPDLAEGVEYLFQADAVDAAGNAATTVLRADGAPMTLRKGDRAAVPRSGRRGGSHRHPGDRAAGAASADTRLVVSLRHGGERGRRLVVPFGAPALLSGRLRRRHGGGLAGRPVRVVVERAGGGRVVERLLTGPAGGFELRLPAGVSRRVRAYFAGSGGLRASRSSSLLLRVRARVSLSAEPSSLRTGEVVRLSGRVATAGAKIPAAGKLVTISYRERETRSWRPVIVTRSDRSGRFHTSYRFRYISGRARIAMRAAAPAEAGWPYAPGYSRAVAITVAG